MPTKSEAANPNADTEAVKETAPVKSSRPTYDPTDYSKALNAKYAIIWRPTMNRSQSMLMLYYPDAVVPPSLSLQDSAVDQRRRDDIAIQNAELSLSSMNVYIGTGFYDWQTWQKAYHHNQTRIDQHRVLGAMVIIDPPMPQELPEKGLVEFTNFTTDYTDQLARMLINESLDVKWLETCAARENRSEIVQLAQRRVALINDMRSRQGSNPQANIAGTQFANQFGGQPGGMSPMNYGSWNGGQGIF